MWTGSLGARPSDSPRAGVWWLRSVARSSSSGVDDQVLELYDLQGLRVLPFLGQPGEVIDSHEAMLVWMAVPHGDCPATPGETHDSLPFTRRGVAFTTPARGDPPIEGRRSDGTSERRRSAAGRRGHGAR